MGGQFVIMALQQSFKALLLSETKDSREVLVTGATGGVGSNCCRHSCQSGFPGRCRHGKDEGKRFFDLPRRVEVITRAEADDSSGRPMLKGRWGGVVDTVGGNILATAIK